jgi:hypothetical protein
MMTDWQPIETAPYGTPILVTDGKVIALVTRETYDSPLFGTQDIFESTVPTDYEWDLDWEQKDLTHWMPSPRLPKGGTNE